MHIAVDTGAKEGESFKQYVDYLDNNHYVPPDGKAWVDYIRTRPKTSVLCGGVMSCGGRFCGEGDFVGRAGGRLG